MKRNEIFTGIGLGAAWGMAGFLGYDGGTNIFNPDGGTNFFQPEDQYDQLFGLGEFGLASLVVGFFLLPSIFAFLEEDQSYKD